MEEVPPDATPIVDLDPTGLLVAATGFLIASSDVEATLYHCEAGQQLPPMGNDVVSKLSAERLNSHSMFFGDLLRKYHAALRTASENFEAVNKAYLANEQRTARSFTNTGLI